MSSTINLKKEFFKLLDEDEEFRYAVAGRLGISKILEELKSLREGQEKLWENQNKLWEEVKKLREDQEKLWENQNKLWQEVRNLWQEVKALREDFRVLRKDLNDVKVTLERVTISEEEEAKEVISYRIKKELGFEVKFERIFVDDKEINLYYSNEEFCIIGEATTRLGNKLVDEIEKKFKIVKEKRPDLIRKKLIKVIYTIVATESSIELAKNYGIWVLNWKEDLSPRVIHSIS